MSFDQFDTQENSLFSDMLHDPEESFLTDNGDLEDVYEEPNSMFDSLD